VSRSKPCRSVTAGPGIVTFVVQTMRHRGEPDTSPFTVAEQQRRDAETPAVTRESTPQPT